MLRSRRKENTISLLEGRRSGGLCTRVFLSQMILKVDLSFNVNLLVLE